MVKCKMARRQNPEKQCLDFAPRWSLASLLPLMPKANPGRREWMPGGFQVPAVREGRRRPRGRKLFFTGHF